MCQQYSYSRVEYFRKCPYQFYLKYVRKYQTIASQGANDARYLGSALHLGLEKRSIREAVNQYISNYYQLGNSHLHELMKLEIMIEKATALLNTIEGELIHEYEIDLPEYKGFVDLIIRKPNGKIDILDFKYSNNEESYLNSTQLHIYKHYLEQVGFEVEHLGYLFIPKVQIRQKKTESLYQFRKRLKREISTKEPYLKWIEYDQKKVTKFFKDIKAIKRCRKFEKKVTSYCNWCDYKKYCLEGDSSEMILPSNERRTVESIEKKVMWLYGAPYSGKTTLANEFPDPLMLNTDGNIRFVDAPYVAIKNHIEMDGRIKNEILAWEVFSATIDELEKKQNTFKTIVVDLLEDVYEHCRVWGYAKLDIEHESDNGFKAYDVIRSEFLRTMSKLVNLDYENIILISHEDISKDIMKKSGDKVTRIAPNIGEKIANKIGGMVDFTARVVAEGNDRKIILRSSDVVFGGGRLQGITNDTISLSYKEVTNLYESINIKASRRRSITNE